MTKKRVTKERLGVFEFRGNRMVPFDLLSFARFLVRGGARARRRVYAAQFRCKDIEVHLLATGRSVSKHVLLPCVVDGKVFLGTFSHALTTITRQHGITFAIVCFAAVCPPLIP